MKEPPPAEWFRVNGSMCDVWAHASLPEATSHLYPCLFQTNRNPLQALVHPSLSLPLPPACKPSTACQCCRPLSLYFPGSVRRVFLPRTQRKHAGLWSGEPGTKPYLFIKQRVGSGRKGWLRGYWMGSGVGHPRGSPALRLSGKGRIPMRKIMCPCECQSSVSRWWESMFSVSSRHNKPD